ncbi:Thylakoid membrane protein slr0575 [Linum perenne]
MNALIASPLMAPKLATLPRFASLTPPLNFFISSHPVSSSPPSTKLNLPRNIHNLRLHYVAKAADSTQPTTSSSSKTLVPDNEFTLAKVSFGVIGLGLGVSLLSYGFGAYFNILAGSEWSALMLTYGFPLAIIGMALKYAELKPVPCLTYSDAEALRETYATPILKQVRNDVTRYRYGDEQHLEEALKRIFQYGQVTDAGKYSLVMVFEAKALELSDFERRQAKFSSFFGPDVTAEVGKGGNDQFEVRLISNLNAKVSSS